MEILKKEEDVLNHMSHAILDDNIELEIIFGYNQYNVEFQLDNLFF